MKIFKIIFGIVVSIILIMGCCVFYAFKIEPYRIETNQYILNEKKSASRDLKIVQFSDLHIKGDFTYKNLDKVVKEINRQNPDLVIFTGDLYDNYAKYNDDENIVAKLMSIKAKYGKIAIWGNRDYGGGSVRKYQAIMESAGFTLLRNETMMMEIKNKNIMITGMDDLLLGKPGIDPIENTQEIDYKILLTHEPDIAEEWKEYDYDLILSGHSHGGQINIPFLPMINRKALSITDFSSIYSGGMYELENKAKTKLYVNTGIGTTHISARFDVIPEIALFYL